MDFSIFYQSKISQLRWANILFYVAILLLLAAGVCYGVFELKVYLVNQRIEKIQQKILAATSPQESLSQKQILDYKKKIEDFSSLVNNHRVSWKVFDFLEKNTLPNVRFSSFNLSPVKGEINVLGQTDTMESLNSQVRIFEENKEYVKSINVLTSRLESQGKVQFVLGFSLNPAVFEYSPNANQ